MNLVTFDIPCFKKMNDLAKLPALFLHVATSLFIWTTIFLYFRWILCNRWLKVAQNLEVEKKMVVHIEFTLSSVEKNQTILHYNTQLQDNNISINVFLTKILSLILVSEYVFIKQFNCLSLCLRLCFSWSLNIYSLSKPPTSFLTGFLCKFYLRINSDQLPWLCWCCHHLVSP